MQPLFTASDDYTLKEYRSFIHTVHMKIFKTPVRVVLFQALLLLLAFVTTDRGVKWGLIVGIMLIPLVLWIINRIRTQKSFQEMTKIDSIHNDFKFYEDHAEISNGIGNTNLFFEKAYRILETKTNFCIMMTKRQGVMLSKENLSSELIVFLHEKVK